MPSIAGPKSTFDIDTDIAQLRQHFANATSIENYFSAPDSQKRPARDAFITGRLVLDDLEFAKWASQFSLTQAEIDSILDITKLTVDAATTLAGGKETKSVLGALSGLLTGSRLSIEKNFFDQKTAQALIAQMIALRKQALIPIQTGMAKGIDQYPIQTAVVDLQSYYFAGTLEGALLGVQQQAAQKDAEATQSLHALRNSHFNDDSNTQAILKWLYPGYVSTNDKGERLDTKGIAIALNDAHLRQLKAWMDNDQVAKDLGMGDLLDGDFPAVRARAVAALNITK